MTQRILVAAVAILLLHVAALAQGPQFSMPTYNDVGEGDIISVPITVENFDSIVSMGMVLRWDPAVIRYIGVSNFNLAGLGADDFGSLDAVSLGELRLVWWLFLQNGTSLPDDTELFKIRFRTVGALTTSTPIEFTEIDPDLFYEIQKADGTTYGLNNSTLTDGFVAIGFSVSNNEPTTNNNTISVVQNPVSASSGIKLSFDNQSNEKDISIQAYDLMGKKLFQQKVNVFSGKNVYELPTFELAQSGVVILQFTTNTGLVHRQKVLLTP